MSGSVVIKTFKNAIKTLIEESKNSVKPKLEFIDKVDKKQSISKVKNATSGNWDFTIGKWNITGNWNSNAGNKTLTRFFETVFDEDFGDYDDFETIFGDIYNSPLHDWPTYCTINVNIRGCVIFENLFLKKKSSIAIQNSCLNRQLYEAF